MPQIWSPDDFDDFDYDLILSEVDSYISNLNMPQNTTSVFSLDDDVLPAAPVQQEPPQEGDNFEIQPYNAKPQTEFHGKELWGEFLGVELEVELAGFGIGENDQKFNSKNDSHNRMRNRAAYIVNKLINLDPKKPFALLKSDGSLKMGGFEICSSPASIDQHKALWGNFFDNLPKVLTTHDTCGMHVHISREPLSFMQIGKIISFIHNPDNKTFIEKIAGRPSCHYSNYSDLKGEKHAMPHYCGSFNHYSAVNLSNANTVELRIFQGTLDKSKFLANLEFCLALVKYSFPSARSLRMKSYKGFVKFIEENYKVYPNLYNFLRSTGYINTPEQKQIKH